MNNLKDILPMLWKLVDEQDCAINISTTNGELVINIFDKKRKRCFRSADSAKLITNLKQYMQA